MKYWSIVATSLHRQQRKQCPLTYFFRQITTYFTDLGPRLAGGCSGLLTHDCQLERYICMHAPIRCPKLTTPLNKCQPRVRRHYKLLPLLSLPAPPVHLSHLSTAITPFLPLLTTTYTQSTWSEQAMSSSSWWLYSSRQSQQL